VSTLCALRLRTNEEVVEETDDDKYRQQFATAPSPRRLPDAVPPRVRSVSSGNARDPMTSKTKGATVRSLVAILCVAVVLPGDKPQLQLHV
jgi:hypothetical protein